MEKKLKVSHVRIQNVLGIAELEFAPGGFTEISGANGSGKTSTIEALRAALRGGHDGTLLRKGEDKGEIVLVLDDGTTIKKSITAEATNVTILRNEKKLSRPAEAIKALHDVLSVNPVEFLRAPEKARVDALLQVMPIEVDRARLVQIAGADICQPVAATGIDLIETIKKAVFDQRTGVNRAARDKEGAINQLRATLPDEVPDAPATDASLLAKLDQIDQARDAELARIDIKMAGIQADYDARAQVYRDRIAAIQREFDEDTIQLAGVKAKADSSRADARSEHAQARAGVQAQLTNIEEAQKQHARFSQTKENVARMAGELDGLKEEAGRYTEALEALDAYKAELLASLPIPGMEITEGSLYRYGIPFDRLNTAQQVEIAIEIAKLRAGELGLICVDGLELLDEKHYEAFRELAAASGLQLIVSRVGTGALTVETECVGPDYGKTQFE